jgi:transposase-like protein
MANTCTSEMCQRVIELMKEGWTQEEVCADLGVNPKTFRRWRDKNGAHYEREFDEAFEIAKMHQFAWWVRKGRMNLTNKEFQTPLFALYMANMFRWRSAASKEDEVMEELREIRECIEARDRAPEDKPTVGAVLAEDPAHKALLR